MSDADMLDIKLSTVYGLSLDEVDIRYVGMTSGELRRRMWAHHRDMKRGSKLPVHNWMRKHGYDCIKVTVLSHTTPDYVYELEHWWVSALRDSGCDLLNLADGGRGNGGRKMPLEERLRRSNGRATADGLCSLDGCGDKYTALGYCAKHARAFRKYGDALSYKPPVPITKVCTFEGCQGKHLAKGKCRKHYGK